MATHPAPSPTPAERPARQPRVSVVIPVFNRPHALRRAIDSVLAQTFQDFEIVVVDDGSTDDTPAALAALTDSRIRVIRHERRRGGSAARNTGIRAARGPYVAFLDSDDEWLPSKLEKQLALFEQGGEHLALVYVGAERSFPDGTIDVAVPRGQQDLARVLLIDNVIGETSLGMVRRSALEAVGGFDEALPAAQDMDLWLRLCGRYAAAAVPEVLARIAKTHDPGRISANIASTTTARELFRQKHRGKLVEQGVLHLHLRESGWWYLRGARDGRQARRCFREALAANPAAPMSYLLYLLACLPVSWVDRAAGWKRRVVRRLA